MNEHDRVFRPPRYSSQELSAMFAEDTIYPELQFSLMITQEFCEDITFKTPDSGCKREKLQAETRKVYGDGFRFVFTRDPDDPEGDRCIIRPYVFTTPDSYLSDDGSIRSSLSIFSSSPPLN